jgi:D-glycero-alpha-D-manno-heptose-7-phosphate kinase
VGDQGTGKGGASFVINSVAPIRICDNGGWTDTWFAGHGRIFNIAVSPHVEVQVSASPGTAGDDQVIIEAENYGDRYAVVPGETRVPRHPLLEAAIDDVLLPGGLSLHIGIYSEVPGGCSTGTSAAVAVALLGALDALTPGRKSPHEIAYQAHRLEVDVLGRQSGIQDQLCSAYGGINYIEMFEYPHATVSRLEIAEPVRWELERRLSLIFLGTGHDSSAVHDEVISGLEQGGRGLAALRETAARARDAVYAGDMDALGRSMIANSEAQAELHPALVGQDAAAVIAVARAHGAIGWKVNGAGGPGGSLTLLSGTPGSAQRVMHRAIVELSHRFRPIAIRLSRKGLRVWRSDQR